MRREVPLLLTFAFGLFMILSNFIIWDRWKAVAENVNNWALIVIAFTYILGVGNLVRVHMGKISRFGEGWMYSAATLGGLSVMILVGAVLWLLPQSHGEASLKFRVLAPTTMREAVHAAVPSSGAADYAVTTQNRIVEDLNHDGTADPGDLVESRIGYVYSGPSRVEAAPFIVTFDPTKLEPAGSSVGAALAPAGPPGSLLWNAGPIGASPFGVTRAGIQQASAFNWIYESIYVPMSGTMYALLAFFISSAAFRAFRVRSTHAVLLGATAIIVILGSVPVGEAVWSRYPSLVEWIMNDLQTAGKRAILIGAALGAIATGVKVIIGSEKSLSAD